MKQCLVVDDSKVVRKFARHLLEELGFNVREAEDGEVALKACAESMPEMMLLDWNMPVKDGLECLEELRAMTNGGSVVVIFCTTQNDMAHIQNAIMTGANEYIMKPFDKEILKDKLIQTGLITDSV
ncbi:MAG: cheY [Rickettsiales bacterium]|jgi:two-component system chemotaxis response regulator CheY|nr:cheY [Rickettsiales bacterium]